MDIQAMQSMDWLFKKERIYLLAQFWQQRATLAEKEVSALKEQLASANQSLHLPVGEGAKGKPGGGAGEDGGGVEHVVGRAAGLEMELAAKEKEVAQLLDDVARLQASLAKLQESSAGQVARLEEQLELKRQHIARLEARLDAQRDYDDVKRELSILRSLEFPSALAAHVGAAAAAGAAGAGPDGGKSLELLLLERSKALQAAENSLKAAAAASSAADVQDAPVASAPSSSSPGAPLEGGAAAPSSAPADAAAVKSEGCASPASRTTPPSSASSASFTASSPPSMPLVSTTPAIATPLACSTPTSGDPAGLLHHHHHHHHHHLMNGNPKTPEDAAAAAAAAGANANQHLLSGGAGLSMGSPNVNNNSIIQPPPPSSTPGGLSYFRNDDNMKSPFRFDDPRSPFRFTPEDAGVMVGRLGESLIPKGDPMEARLQEMLRYNMDKYSTQNLDTLHISRRVRELLSINNIGQRLFAKYVLGLSQGTVSELLSKPKPWDKLTEKGRDSYRKMHAWACDENAVLLLKSLIPKKVFQKQQQNNRSPGDVWNPLKSKDSGIPAFGRGDADNMTEERIAHILSEASQMMKSQVEDSHSNDSKSPNQGQCPSPLGKDAAAQSRRLKKYENDDIPQEKVVRIYQEELAKLMGRRVEEGALRDPRQHFPSLLFPHFFSGGGGGGAGGGPPPMDRAQEEIRMALDAYHRELAKLNSVSCPTSAASAAAGLPGLPGLLALQQQALSQQQQQQQQQQHQQQQQQQQHAQLNGVAQDLSMPKDRSKEPCKDKLPNGELLLDPDKKDGVAAAAAAAAAASVMDSVADVLRHAGSAFSLVRPKVEPGGAPTAGQPSTTGSSTGSSPLSNSILPPAMTPADDFVGSAAASPLQRMASITNSLISQPSTPTHHSPSQRPLKAVLPPITQQQFDMFNNLNTEDIVKKVKEALSQYSISQRLFGESVLGLSQGSVSDLLARPKPWHMLTQKGREPFIRMKMFLEDENAVHKLVASQYKIAPEKLMRTGNYAGGPPCSLGKPQPPVSKMTAHDSLAGKGGHLGGPDGPGGPGGGPPILPPTLQQMVAGGHPPSQGAGSVPPPPPPLLVTPPGHHPLATSLPADLKKSHPQGPNPHGLHPHHQQQPPPGALRAMQQHMTPSVYEMAALTQDLDTQVITTKIKEALLANNIGQKIFGEAVLGLSQGSVSELLSKPKPWHMLSIKGREPFIRMQLWLSDANNIDRLQALKNERREANKRRRSSGPGHHGGSSGGGGGADNSSDTSSNDTSEFYHSPSPGPGPPSAKKQRVLFSEEQKEALRLAFALDSYPSMQTIEFLGSELALSSRTITNWFHNHRMRLKQQVPHGMSPENSNMPPVSREGGSFDPVQFRLLLNQRLLELQKERMGLGGVHLPYSPYFAANNNLAALMGRGLMPPGECDLAGNLGGVGGGNKEQFSGLDLSMSGLKREPDFEDEEDVDSNVGSEDSNMSSSSLRETAVKKESAVVLPPTIGPGAGRSSRRKPAAPQWVNPEWQEVSGAGEEGKEKGGDKEVIINGVCVMQTDDYGIKMSKDEETVRVEPTPVMDRYEDDDEEDQCSDASSEAENQNLETSTPATPQDGIIPPTRSSDQGEPEDEGRSNKSEPSSPLFKEEEDSTPRVQAETPLASVKQEMEDQDVPENDQPKGEWEENSCKQEALDKLPKIIKTENRQDDGWEY